jgi:hypothetical protein
MMHESRLEHPARVVIGQSSYPTSRVKYRVNEEGSEELLSASRLGVIKVLLVVKPASEDVLEPT